MQLLQLLISFHGWEHLLSLNFLEAGNIQWIIIRSYKLPNILCISWGTSHAISGIVCCNYGTIHGKMRNKARPICAHSNNEGPLMWCSWRFWHERPLSFMLYMTVHWNCLFSVIALDSVGYVACLVEGGAIWIVISHTLSCPWQRFMNIGKDQLRDLESFAHFQILFLPNSTCICL